MLHREVRPAGQLGGPQRVLPPPGSRGSGGVAPGTLGRRCGVAVCQAVQSLMRTLFLASGHSASVIRGQASGGARGFEVLQSPFGLGREPGVLGQGRLGASRRCASPAEERTRGKRAGTRPGGTW